MGRRGLWAFESGGIKPSGPRADRCPARLCWGTQGRRIQIPTGEGPPNPSGWCRGPPFSGLPASELRAGKGHAIVWTLLSVIFPSPHSPSLPSTRHPQILARVLWKGARYSVTEQKNTCCVPSAPPNTSCCEGPRGRLPHNERESYRP